jgi:hypothetical protein
VVPRDLLTKAAALAAAFVAGLVLAVAGCADDNTGGDTMTTRTTATSFTTTTATTNGTTTETATTEETTTEGTTTAETETETETD